MNILKLALKNIRGNGTRSLIIFLCILGIAGFFVSTTLIVRGAENSLNRGLERLGADILVVPQGAELKVETALLMGKPTKVWMPSQMMAKLAGVQGVDRVSPQIYLQSLYGAECCAVSEMFLIVYDPATDFAVTPWLKRNLGRDLVKGEVIGGSYIFTPPGEKHIRLYDYNLTLRGNLEKTGTGIDQTMFMTLETAMAMAERSATSAESVLEIPPNNISAVMIKVDPGSDPHKVSLQILKDVLGVVPIESPNLFGTFREQMLGLLWGFFALLIIAWIICAVLIGLVFSLAVNERRREIAVERALGATRFFVFRSLITETAILAAIGGIMGVVLSSLTIFIFQDYIAGSLKMPFLFPSLTSMLIILCLGLVLSLLTVAIAVFLPAFRISKQEPAIAMRE